MITVRGLMRWKPISREDKSVTLNTATNKDIWKYKCWWPCPRTQRRTSPQSFSFICRTLGFISWKRMNSLEKVTFLYIIKSRPLFLGENCGARISRNGFDGLTSMVETLLYDGPEPWTDELTAQENSLRSELATPRISPWFLFTSSKAKLFFQSK